MFVRLQREFIVMLSVGDEGNIRVYRFMIHWL